MLWTHGLNGQLGPSISPNLDNLYQPRRGGYFDNYTRCRESEFEGSVTTDIVNTLITKKKAYSPPGFSYSEEAVDGAGLSK